VDPAGLLVVSSDSIVVELATTISSDSSVVELVDDVVVLASVVVP
jgi:hypothetical protein